MVTDTDGTFLFCDWPNHDWEKQYYGTKCKICGLFFADGCAPWDSEQEDDNEGSV